MQVEHIKFPSKSWGVIEIPFIPGHYHTGYEKEWSWSLPRELLGDLSIWDLARQHGVPKALMNIGSNVIITGAFRIGSFSRGRSAANFHGHFKGHEQIGYELSMDGTADLWRAVQDGVFPLKDGYIEGRFTFSKNGQNIFLKPYLGD